MARFFRIVGEATAVNLDLATVVMALSDATLVKTWLIRIEFADSEHFWDYAFATEAERDDMLQQMLTFANRSGG
jgi:hypothetical protein